MRSLFFKIFAIFWIAQSLIFVISTALILSRRFPGPEPLTEPLMRGLARESSEAVTAFEAKGCPALNELAAPRKRNIALEDASGKSLCTAGDAPPSLPASSSQE